MPHVIYEPDEIIPRRVLKGIAPPPSNVHLMLAQVRAATRHIASDYRDYYFATYSQTTKPADEEKGHQPSRHHKADPTGEVTVNREQLRDELFTATEKLADALALLQSARGLVNHVGQALSRP